MKKSLLALGVALASVFTAAAANNEYTCTPAEGAINMNDYPGGVGSIELNCTATINRNCEFLAYLSKDGTPIKAIPANNVRMVYCVDGFDKVETGTPHISFFESAISPASKPGNYTVTIPSNFFTVNGVPNAQLVYNFTIAGSSVTYAYNPAKNSTVQAFSTMTVTFEDATSVTYKPSANSNAHSETGVYYELPDPDDEDAVITVDCTDVQIDGNVATITFPTCTYNGVVDVNILAGRFEFTDKKGQTARISDQVIHYTNVAALPTDVPTLTPGSGTFEGGLKPISSDEVDGTTRYNYFVLKLPENYTFGYMNARKMGIYKEQANGSLKVEDIYNDYFNTWSKNEDGNSANIYKTVDEFKLAPGTYYFVIPASTFQMKNGDVALGYNQELKFGPFIIEGAPAAYTVEPAADKAITELSEITITFEEGSEVEVKKTAWFTIMNGEIEYDLRGTVNGNVVTIKIEPPLTTTGEYTLISDASNILVDGRATGVEAKFNIVRNFISNLTLVSNGRPVNAEIVEDEDFGETWAVTVNVDEGSEEATLTFELPYGYDSVYVQDYSFGFDPLRYRVSTEELVAAGLKKCENNSVTLTPGIHMLQFSYANGNEALEPSPLKVTVEANTTGVETVNVADGKAEYYTLQGVKVVNPDKGIYIKVANGKAAKVVR